MKINVFHRVDTPSGMAESIESTNLPENLEETVLIELGKLLKDPDIFAGVQYRVNGIEETTQRQLVQATLYSMQHTQDDIRAVQDEIHDRLSWLRDAISV